MKTLILARVALVVLVAATSTAVVTLAVDRNKFHTCRDTGFCRRNRHTPVEERARYYIDSTEVAASEGVVDAVVFGGAVHLHARLLFYASGVARLQVREQHPLRERWELDDVVLDHQLSPAKIEVLEQGDARVPKTLRKRHEERRHANAAQDPAAANLVQERGLIVLYGEVAPGVPLICDVAADPIVLSFYEGDELTTSVNSGGLLHFEHHRSRDGTPQIDGAKEDQDRHGNKEVVGCVHGDEWAGY